MLKLELFLAAVFSCCLAALPPAAGAQTPRTCSVADCDGDSIPNDGDDQPVVADIPEIRFTSEDTELGIDFQVSGQATATSTSKSVRSTLLSTSVTGTDRRTRTDKTTLRRSFSGAIGAALTAGEFKPTFNLSLNADTSDEISNTVEKSILREEQQKYTEQVDELVSWEQTTSAAYGPNSGYIRAGVEFANVGLIPVRIKDIRYAIQLVDPCDAARPSTIFTGMINESNFQRTSGPAEPPSEATAAQEKPAERRVQPGLNVPEVIWLQKLSTNIIQQAINSKRIPKLQITDYTLTAGGAEVNEVTLHNSVMRKSIQLRILGRDDADRTYYVSAIDGNTSLVGALLDLQLGPVETVEHDGSVYLSRIGDTRSDFYPPFDPRRFTNDELGQGAWFVAVHTPSFSGSITTPAPPGTRFSVVYLTKEDLLKAIREVKLIPSSDTQWINVDTPLFNPAIHKVKIGDVVKLRFRGVAQTDAARAEVVAARYRESNVHFLEDKRFWEFYHATETLISEEFQQIAHQQKPGSYGLAISFRTGQSSTPEISLNDVPLLCASAFRRNPDGSAEVEFVVTESLLPAREGVIQLHAQPFTVNVSVGREFTYPPQRDDVAAIPCPICAQMQNAIEAWAAAYPRMTRPIPRMRKFEVRMRIIASPSPAQHVPPRGTTPREQCMAGDSTQCQSIANTFASQCQSDQQACLRQRCFENRARQLTAAKQVCDTFGDNDIQCKQAKSALMSLTVEQCEQ